MFNKEKHSTILLAPHLGDISINFVPLRQSGTGALSKHAQSGQGRRSFFLWTLALSIPVLYLCQQLLQHLEAGNDSEHTRLLPQHILGRLAGIPLSTTLSLAIGLALVLLVLFACGKGRRTMPDHLRKAGLVFAMLALLIIPSVAILCSSISSETIADILIGGSVIGMMIAIALNVLHARKEMSKSPPHQHKAKPQQSRTVRD